MSLKKKPTGKSRAIYECDVCGRVDHWSQSWCWFGSLRSMENSDGSIIETVCSEKCRKNHRASNEPILDG